MLWAISVSCRHLVSLSESGGANLGYSKWVIGTATQLFILVQNRTARDGILRGVLSFPWHVLMSLCQRTKRLVYYVLRVVCGLKKGEGHQALLTQTSHSVEKYQPIRLCTK